MMRCIQRHLVLISFTIFSFLTSFSKDKNVYIKSVSYSFVNTNDTTPSILQLDFFVSNKGSDSNDGRSVSTAKLNLSSIESLLSTTPIGGAGVSVNLEENSLFREQYDPLSNNQRVRTFGLKTPNRLAKISGMDIIRDWNASPSGSSIFQHLLKNTIDLSNPRYTYIMIAEIDTALEKTRPVSAVKYLSLVQDIQTCGNTPGTYYTPPVTSNNIMTYIHPTEGMPGSNKFRYEVTTRNNSINGYSIDNATYENLFLQTSSYGYGMLSAGKNTTVRNVIFQGGGIHHTVIKSGVIDSCLFLAGPKGLRDRIAAVFYSAEGTGSNNKLTNTIFLDIPNAVYAHTNGINHKSLLLDKVYAFADTTDAGNALSAGDTDSVDVADCYVEGYPTGWYGGAAKLNIKNSIFRNTNQSAIFLFSEDNIVADVKISNTLIKTSGNDKNQNIANGWVVFGVRSPYYNLNLEMSNSIIHGFSTWHGEYNTISSFQVGGALKAHHNIYICDVNAENSMYMTKADNSTGRGTATNIASNYNAYILLRGSKFIWNVGPNINNENSLSTLSEWQSLTGQDKNSIIIDLRNNPLGLKAIFVDPDNGNWTLAQTPQADSVRMISAGMITPPLYYPKRPSMETNGTPFKMPGGISSLNGTLRTELESIVQWQTFSESDFSSFLIEYSMDGIHFLDAGTVKPANDSKNNNYQYIHTHLGTDSIFFRLKYSYSDSSSKYSSIIKLRGQFSQELKIVVYPNPFKHNITVWHPRRNNGEIRIFDYNGKIIKTTIVASSSSKTPVNLSNLPAGRYFVQWLSNHEMLTGSIVK